MFTDLFNQDQTDRRVEIKNQSQKKPDLVCFSHLRWDFVHQRPQHLLKRAASDRRVFFFEEPIFDKGTMRLEIQERDPGVWLAVPHLPTGLGSAIAVDAVLSEMVSRLFMNFGVREYLLWYYTPMALSFSSDLSPVGVVYDCMDELSAFKNAPQDLSERELQLFRRADLVFTGGRSLFEAKRNQHHAVHEFPSSIDIDHFRTARKDIEDPVDQKEIGHPRLGFFGVVDERTDLELLDTIAQARPDWHFVIIGPIVKIDPTTLPQYPNIHYLGPKRYEELPTYIANWQVALLPFAINEATRFISPTKTPEYLAAGKPVVSTPIRDVIDPYGNAGFVHIADGPSQFISAIESCLANGSSDQKKTEAIDRFLSANSWDLTWARMAKLIDDLVDAKRIMRPTLEQPLAQSRGI